MEKCRRVFYRDSGAAYVCTAILVLLSVDMQTGFLMQRLILMEWNISLRLMTVSYTHLDVYKRQVLNRTFSSEQE